MYSPGSATNPHTGINCVYIMCYRYRCEERTHVNVITIRGFFCGTDHVYIMMDLAECSMETFMKSKKFKQVNPACVIKYKEPCKKCMEYYLMTGYKPRTDHIPLGMQN